MGMCIFCCHRVTSVTEKGFNKKKFSCVFSDVTESPVSPAGLGNYCCFFTFVFFLMSPVSPSHQCHREGAALKKKWGCVFFDVTESPVSPRRSWTKKILDVYSLKSPSHQCHQQVLVTIAAFLLLCFSWCHQCHRVTCVTEKGLHWKKMGMCIFWCHRVTSVTKKGLN